MNTWDNGNIHKNAQMDTQMNAQMECSLGHTHQAQRCIPLVYTKYTTGIPVMFMQIESSLNSEDWS